MPRSITNPFRRYGFFVGLLIALFFAALAPEFATWEPYYGSQTRVAALPERDYGWNRRQEFFERREYRIVNHASGYDRPYDIVVVGDSFSALEYTNSWLDYLSDASGASIFCLWGKPKDFKALLKSEMFASHPPRLLIYETVERSLLERLSFLEVVLDAPGAPPRPIVAPPLVLRPRHAPRTLRDRPRSAPALQTMREVASAVQTRLGLRLAADGTDVAELNRGDLFSSARSSELLMLSIDRRKNNFGTQDVNRAVQGLRRVEALVESNGRTRFMFVAFPDKSSIYARYMRDRAHATPNHIQALAEQVPILRTDRLLAAELDRGTVDLYLPDDSHTNAVGNRLVTEAVIEVLLQNGTFTKH